MARNIKITLGKYAPKNIHIPNVGEVLRALNGEMIMLCGDVSTSDKAKNYRMAFGIGYVIKISHGESFDLVYMSFGGPTRKLMVIDNRARRMILTLKRGQLAMFTGYGRIYTATYDDGTKKRHWQFYAVGLQGWYVPKMLEIRKAKNDPDNQIEEMSVNDTESMIAFLDQFNEGDDEN